MGITSALLYRWLLASAALQSRYLGRNVFNKQSRPSYDFVIVGGGTAGSVLASRLSEIPDFNVLLLEKGNSGNDFIDIGLLMNDAESQEFCESMPTLQQKHAWLAIGGLASYVIGRGLGGGSTHNAMNYVRGSPLDYDTWSQVGARGWSYKQVLPFFKKLETYHPNPGVAYDRNVRGFTGPIHAQPLAEDATAGQAFLDAAKEIGMKVGDYNSYFKSFDILQTSQLNGVRSSTRRGYLLPAIGRPNLDIVCQATVTRVLFRSNRAIGVEYERDNVTRVAHATREVILSASALRTPQLLMLSGIGPAGTLAKFQIPVLKDAPGVGSNLQDHPSFTVFALLSKPLYQKQLTMQDIRDYDSNKTGPLTNPSAIGLGSTTNYQSVNEYDIRVQIPMFGLNAESLLTRLLYPSPLGVRYRPISVISDAGEVSINTLVFENLLLMPDSRGSVSIASKRAKDWPIIDAQILSDVRDRQAAGDVLRQVANLTRTKALTGLGITAVVFDRQLLCSAFPADSQDFYECCAMQYTNTAWHYCGTAKIGPVSDPLSVVDPSLRVYGTRGLRVVDASVMPTIPRGNINIPVVMIAEKAADMIKAEYSRSRLPLILQRFDHVTLLQQSLPVAPLPDLILP